MVDIPKTLWHGTDAEPFENFDPSRFGPWKFGFWLTDDQDFAGLFGDNVAEAEASVSRPFRISIERWNGIRDRHHDDGEWFARWRQRLQNEGYDSLYVEPSTTKLGRFEVRDPGVLAVFDAEAITIRGWLPRPSDTAKSSL